MSENILNLLYQVPLEAWRIVGQMSPYLLFGFLMAGILSVIISAKWIERHLGGRGFGPVIKAAFFGVPLPVCSCGVIPLAASLRRHGASKSATTAFLISTPQTGAESIVLTAGVLGPAFATFAPVAAFLTGVFGGSLVNFVDRNQVKAPAGGTEEEERSACCATDTSLRHKAVEALRYGFVRLPRDIGKEVLIGLLLAGLITALIPDDFFAEYLGGGLHSMLVMMLVGLPIYVCSSASVPIAAALILKGVSPGAALVFLLTGPATNMATIVTIWKILGHRLAIIYLSSVAIGAFAAGLLLDMVLGMTTLEVAPGHHMMENTWLPQVSAVVLLAVLLAQIVPWRRKKPVVATAGCCATEKPAPEASTCCGTEPAPESVPSCCASKSATAAETVEEQKAASPGASSCSETVSHTPSEKCCSEQAPVPPRSDCCSQE